MAISTIILIHISLILKRTLTVSNTFFKSLMLVLFLHNFNFFIFKYPNSISFALKINTPWEISQLSRVITKFYHVMLESVLLFLIFPNHHNISLSSYSCMQFYFH